MTTGQFPVGAAWLLRAFRITEHNPALIGDLTEEFRGGRSSAWLWKQVLAAIAFRLGKELCNHKLLTIRAVVAGEAVVWLSSRALGATLYSRWIATFLNTVWLHWFPSAGWTTFIIAPAAIASLIGGWVVSRFHGEHRMALVLLFATLQFVLILSTGDLHRLLVNSIDQPRFRPYLRLHALVLLCCPLAVLIGGYLGARSPRSATRQSLSS